jgi:hypothetical protein
MSSPRFSIRRQFAQRLTDVPVVAGLPSADAIKDELLSMANVLLGRVDAPVDHGVMTRMEVALAYYARACELDMLIHEQERVGNIVRGSDHYRVRTGALRTFIEMSKEVVRAGSRNLTHEMHLYKMQMDAGA